MFGELTVFSQVLQTQCHITVVGPRNPDAKKPMKAAYVLHGLIGNNTDWIQYTSLPLLARDGQTLFVLPCVGRSWYIDSISGQQWFTYVSQELPQICRRFFNISDKPEDTAVLGNSMGGYGALKCALSFPEKYGLCCAFSPAAMYWDDYFHTEDCQDCLEDLKGIFGPELSVPAKDHLPLLAQKAFDGNNKLIIRIFCGDGDILLDQNRRFAREMQALAPDFRYHEGKGIHDWIFWNESLERLYHEFHDWF